MNKPVNTPANTSQGTSQSTSQNAHAVGVRAETLAWIEHAVIGLNLCPFARAVQVRKQIRCIVSEATDTGALLAQLCEEMNLLAEASPARIETSLIVHPLVLADFADYNDFLDLADAALEELQLDGVLQVASFHPQYQFAGTEADDLSNATNRSPYPTLHLLREASITRAVDSFGDTETIFDTNIETLEALGVEGWAALCSRCADEAQQAAAAKP